MKKILFLGILIMVGGAFFLFYFESGNGKKIVPKIDGFFSSRNNIESLLQDPRKYEGQKVEVKGVVEASLSLGVRVYKISDSTGSIYIRTDKAVPLEGEKVEVSGTFNQFIKIGTNQYSVIEED